MEIFDAICIFVGRVVVCASIALALICLGELLLSWAYQSFRYIYLIFRADAVHGDLISQEYKSKPLWKARFVLRVLFRGNGLEAALMGRDEEWTLPGRFIFSRKKSIVCGKKI